MPIANDVASLDTVSSLLAARERIRTEAENIITYAYISIKHRYNSKYKPLTLNASDIVYIKLHYGYKLLGVTSRKLG